MVFSSGDNNKNIIIIIIVYRSFWNTTLKHASIAEYPGGLESLFDNTRPFGVIIFVRVCCCGVRFCA
jgi:hypothetical protein